MELGTLNLGQGFPDYKTLDITENSALLAAQDRESYDISSPKGVKRFRESFAKVASQRLNRTINPDTEIYADIGCSGTFATVVPALLQEGDECILFEPFFLWYPFLEMAGIKCKTSMFEWDEGLQRFIVNKEQVRSLITPKTKLITLINPNNPDGKMWTAEELEFIREICLENPQIMVFADQVYNLFMFDGRKLTSFASLPDMFERTITFYSPGKEFSCTGWRVGVAIGPENLIERVVEYQRWNSAAGNSNTQAALSYAYTEALKPYKREGENYFDWKNKDYQQKKDRVVEVVKNAKNASFEVVPAEGGYTFNCFITNDIGRVPVKHFYLKQELPEDFENKNTVELNQNGGLVNFDDWKNLPNVELTPDQAYNQWMSRVVGITGIPASYLFYNKNVELRERKGVNMVRFSLCKRMGIFDEMEEAFSAEIKSE